MSIGAELAEARRKLGFSVEGLSTKTKIKIERLNAIEQMDVEQLPTLVYLKGFLRAYATEVQLDPDDATQRYLAELDVVAPSYAERATSGLSVPGDAALNELHAERDLVIDDLRGPGMPPAARHPATGDRAARALDARFFKAYVTPIDEHDVAMVPPGGTTAPRSSTSRYAPAVLVAVVAGVVGWVVGSNVDLITRRSSQAPLVARDAEPERSARASDARHTNAPEQVAPAVAGDSNIPDTRSERTLNTDSVPRDARRGPDSEPDRGQAAAKTDTARGTAPAGPRANEPVAPAIDPTTDAEPSVEAKPREASSHDLSGRWALTNRVESASYGPSKSLNLGFHLQLQQRGNRVIGTGQKWMENGRTIPARSRTLITVEGTLTGRRLELNFTERGTERTSTGTFVMNVADDSTLRGSFVSDAANAHGTSLARRIESPRR